MTPWPKDIKIKRGDTKEIYFRVRTRVWNPALNGGAGGYEAGPYRNLTGWTVLAQIRATQDSATPLAEFDATLSDQVADTGGVLLKLSPADTAAIPSGTHGYDVQLTDANGDVWTYIEGEVEVSKDYSRAGA